MSGALDAYTSAALLKEVARRLRLDDGDWIVSYGVTELEPRWIDAHRPPLRQRRERNGFLRVLPDLRTDI